MQWDLNPNMPFLPVHSNQSALKPDSSWLFFLMKPKSAISTPEFLELEVLTRFLWITNH